MATGDIERVFEPQVIARDVIDILAGETFSYIVKTDMSLWAAGGSNGGSIWMGLPNHDRAKWVEITDRAEELGLGRPVIKRNTCETIERSVCSGDTLRLNGETFTSSGDYSQVLTNTYGLDSILDIQLEVLPHTEGFLAHQMCWGDSIRIEDVWYASFGDFVDTLQNAQGCDSILHIQITSKCKETPYIPTAFSPNGDKLNDTFKPLAIHSGTTSMRVYNRWGEQLYFKIGKPEWDGTHQGTACPPGVYLFVIDIQNDNGELTRHPGVVTLLR